MKRHHLQLLVLLGGLVASAGSCACIGDKSDELEGDTPIEDDTPTPDPAEDAPDDPEPEDPGDTDDPDDPSEPEDPGEPDLPLFAWPFDASVETYVYQTYGQGEQKAGTLSAASPHAGLDITYPYSEDPYVTVDLASPVAGEVVEVKDPFSGNAELWIHPEDTPDEYLMCLHLSGEPAVTAGDEVSVGSKLGFLGEWGGSSHLEPHLHLAVGPEVPVDSTDFTSTRNPLLYFDAARDEEPPSFLPGALDGVPVAFHGLTLYGDKYKVDDAVTSSNIKTISSTEPEATNPPVKIVKETRFTVYVAATDHVKPPPSSGSDERWDLAPYQVQVSILNEDGDVMSGCHHGLRLDAPLYTNTATSSIFVGTETFGPGNDAEYVFQTLGMQEVVGDVVPTSERPEGAESTPLEPMDTHLLETGKYLLRVRLTDLVHETDHETWFEVVESLDSY